MARYRYKFACGHSSAVTAMSLMPERVLCEKCYGEVAVVGRKQLSDSAKLPSETRDGRDRAARTVSPNVPNHAGRSWPVR